jgi:CheY-like chemotaxis protein
MSKNILVVEDNTDDSNVMSNIIEMIMHHRATRAHDGLEAVRLAKETLFDIILLDLRLPKLQGIQVAEALRQMEKYRNTPIIAVTAYDLAGTRRRALQAGCSFYVTKPIDVESLIDIVSTQLALG